MEENGINGKGDGASIDKAEKNNKVFKIAIIVLLLLLVVVGTALVTILTREKPLEYIEPPQREVVDTPVERGVIATEGNLADIIAQLAEPVEDGYFVTSMNTEWVFDSWDSPARNAMVRNSIDNQRTIYFDLTLRETSELLFSSPFIPVGAALDSLTLNGYLPPGDHQAIVTYHLVDDNYENLSNVSVAVVLKILG